MKQITAEDVRATLEAEWEDTDTPERVLWVLRQHDGKLLTKRILKELPGGDDVWFLRDVAGMKKLETREYSRTGGSMSFSFLLAYANTNVAINAQFVEEYNSQYFSACKERNAKRLECKNSILDLEDMARRLNAVAAARAALKEAEEGLDDLTAYDKPFSPDSTLWEKMSGKEKSR